MALSTKFMATVLAIPNELTIAAANFNFDFSLMKVDAPKEFHGVRDALSHHRRTEAEDGQPHVTARRLGALFEALVPPIPHLLAAYGTRVSEISSHVTKESSRLQNTGIFSPQAGPDGTNIWAAATSGKGALAIHLLACMLSRMWKSHEATSIWVELVERRRQEINDNFTNTSTAELAAMMAAKQIFDRQQLASWDSSARSWLQTADATRRLQHTQLMLIISNVQLPVNPSTDTYESVMQAWKSALGAMERLVQGIPQQVQDGAVLLGISAWHLYPDMEVLGDEITSVQQNDELMNHALLTIPAQQVNVDREGVFWSLPLSRMRYYSAPVVAERRLASDTSRISMEDLHIVVLGVVISQWGDSCTSADRGFKLIISLAKLAAESIPWLNILAEAAQMMLNSHGVEKKYLVKLFRMGMRRCHSFLTDAGSPLPPQAQFFGLTSFTNLLGILNEMDSKIAFLRNIAEDMQAVHGDLVIRYNMSWRLAETQQYLKETRFECASAIPRVRSSSKRTHDNIQLKAKGHSRWIPLRSNDHVSISCAPIQGIDEADDADQNMCGCMRPSNLPCLCHDEGVQCSYLCHPAGIGCSNQDYPLALQCEDNCPGKGECLSCFQVLTQKAVEQQGEECHFIPPGALKSVDDWHFLLKMHNDEESVVYDFVLGDTQSIGIYQRNGARISRYTGSSDGASATMDEIEAAIASSDLNGSHLGLYLRDWWCRLTIQPLGGQLQLSFGALVFANSLYSRMMEATIDVEAINLPLYEAHWSRINVSGLTQAAQLARCFSCIAMFEGGEFNLDPSSLMGVMALSVGDSIYVASALLMDPAVDTSSFPVQRVFGNLGRPEMVLLIPPSKPRLEAFDAHSWRLVNHEPFDGKSLIDNFPSTSLHLSFTDFELAVDVGSRGLRDSRVVLVESLISINHRGKHVGDLDILSMFQSENLTIQRSCDQTDGQHDGQFHGKSFTPGLAPIPINELITVDSWEEFQDFPESMALFRATGNWQARLAGAAAGIQSGKRVLILPSKPCLECVRLGSCFGTDLLIS